MSRRAERIIPAQWKIEIPERGPFGACTVTISVSAWPWGLRRWVVSEDRAYAPGFGGVETGSSRYWQHWTRSGALDRAQWLVAHARLVKGDGPTMKPKETP